LEKIAELEGVDPSYVFVGNGVSDIMDKIMNVTAVKGTNILFPAPVFPPYLDLNKKTALKAGYIAATRIPGSLILLPLNQRLMIQHP